MRSPTEYYSGGRVLWRLRDDPPRLWYEREAPSGKDYYHWDQVILPDASVSDAPFELTPQLRLSESMLAHLISQRDDVDWLRVPDVEILAGGVRRVRAIVWIFLGPLKDLDEVRPTRKTPRPFPAVRPTSGGGEKN